MSDTTYEAATLEDALEKAAAALGVSAAELEHEVVEEKRDFWGGGDDTIVIKAWQKTSAPEAAAVVEEEQPEPEAAVEDAEEHEAPEPKEEQNDESAEEQKDEPAEAAARDDAGAEEAASDQSADGAEEAAAGDDEQPEVVTEFAGEVRGDDEGTVEPEHISALLEQIFYDMEFECTVEVTGEADEFLATIGGADKEALLEGNGRCLSALELLANNAFRNRLSRGSKIRVDAGDFRSKRDQELADVAYQVAHSAKQTGRTQETQPLNPYERRLVHLALAEDPTVTTRSRGSGFLKNVQVIPQKGGRGGRGRR